MYREYSDLPTRRPTGAIVDRAQRTVRLAARPSATAAQVTARPRSVGRLMISGLTVRRTGCHVWGMRIVVMGIGVLRAAVLSS